MKWMNYCILSMKNGETEIKDYHNYAISVQTAFVFIDYNGYKQFTSKCQIFLEF